jgi:multidrug efflux pump subunit AcrA (membrane-fusion protein)
MKQFIVLLVFVLLVNPACKKKRPDIITCDLKRSDYIETIDVTGTIQAVNNVTITAPTTSVTNLIQIVHLAEDGAHVNKGDTICTFAVPDLVNVVESFKADLEKLEGDLKKLEVDNAMQLALLNAQVETNKAQIAITMLDSLKMKFAPPTEKKLLTLEMEKALIERNKLQKKFNAQKRINSSELIKLTSRIMMQKSRIQMFQDQINSLKLVSPVDGIIMHVQNYRLDGGAIMYGDIEEGSSTLSNMSVLKIPDMNTMQVSAEVQEADFKEIQNGQKVLINVEASSNLQTTGKIKRKSLQKPQDMIRTSTNSLTRTSIKTYEVLISIDSCHLRMKPGLSAMCRIIVQQVKDTIVVPAVAIFQNDSSKFVYVSRGKKFTPVTVESGLSNSSDCIISKGLTGNETIALTQPPHNMIREEAKKKPVRTNDNGLGKKDTIIRRTIGGGLSFN